MVKKTEAQYSFNGGEISPYLFARTDTTRYQSSVERMRNACPMQFGGAKKRPGTKYITEVKDSSKQIRLVPFEIDVDNSFILEFGNLYVRFYTLQGVVESSPGVPYEVVTTYTESQLNEITYAQDGNTLYLCHPDVAPAKLTRNSTTSWTLSTVSFSPPPTYEPGDVLAANLTLGATSGTGVSVTASAGVFLNGDIGRRLLNSTGAGIASIVSLASTSSVTVDIIEAFPSTSLSSGNWMLDLSPIASVTPSGTKTGSIINLTAAVATWKSSDVGKYILINNGVGIITVITSNTVAKAQVVRSLENTSATSNWSLETPTWTASRGYPRAVGFFEQRLMFAGTETQPNTVWGSEVAIYNGFGTGTDDDAGIEFDLKHTKPIQIKWIATARDLIIGSSRAESTISSGLTATNVEHIVRSNLGSFTQQPVYVGNEVLFIQGSKTRIHSFQYNFDIDGYKPSDLTFFSNHLTSSGLIKQMCYAQEPDSRIYAVLLDGTMLVGTYNKEQQVFGWALYSTEGSYEFVQTIPNGTVDEVWVCVKRTVNGSTKRYIELLVESEENTNIDGYSDCFLVYSNPKTITGATKANPCVITSTSHGFSNGDTVKILEIEGMTELNNRTYTIANVTANTFELSDVDSSSYTTYTSGGVVHKMVQTISGLSHLEGMEVEIKTDGGVHPSKTVSGGSISLDYKAAEVTVGLNYSMEIKTLRKELNIGGSVQGQRLSWTRPIIRVYKSALPLVDGNYLPSRNVSDLMDTAIPLYSGDLEYGALPWGNTGSITITHSGPFPVIILGIFGSIEANNI